MSSGNGKPVAKDIGTTTYGKGIGQRMIRQIDGSGLNLTMFLYNLHDGSNVEKIEVAPDHEVEVRADDEGQLLIQRDWVGEYFRPADGEGDGCIERSRGGKAVPRSSETLGLSADLCLAVE